MKKEIYKLVFDRYIITTDNKGEIDYKHESPIMSMMETTNCKNNTLEVFQILSNQVQNQLSGQSDSVTTDYEIEIADNLTQTKQIDNLMVGDWILDKSGEPRQVVDVMSDGSPTVRVGSSKIWLCHYEPMVLSHLTLPQNGWKQESDCLYKIMMYSCELEYNIYTNSMFVDGKYIGKIEYVHQLQHLYKALRLMQEFKKI